MTAIPQFYVFAGSALVAKGTAAQLLGEYKSPLHGRAADDLILFFDSNTGRQVDVDVSAEECTGQGQASGSTELVDESKFVQKKARGRPRLGVVGREVTLLPRHWEWLDQQRGGASAALRRLIDENRKERAAEDAIREAQDSANRFMMAIAGDLPGFEEAVRALYARDGAKFREETQRWPADIRRCASDYAEAAFT